MYPCFFLHTTRNFAFGALPTSVSKVPLSRLKYASPAGTALNPLPSDRVVPFILWLCPTIFVPFGSVFSAFIPTVSLPFVVSGLGVLSCDNFGVFFTTNLLFL